jgi:MoaA/NifB/PqqE/SkfB family radical SAM enzyme
VNKIINYTSTGLKMLKHLDTLSKMQSTNFGIPIQAHVMPTSVCNLNCSFCSNVNRKTSSLDLKVITNCLDYLISKGLKSCEITGGGEPLLYPQINDLFEYILSKGLKLGLITNGTMFKKLNVDFLNKLSWIRVSTNTSDYSPMWKPPYFSDNITYGFSYVWGKDSSVQSLIKIRDWAIERKVKYVRIVPDCCESPESVVTLLPKLDYLVSRIGEPLFLQNKVHCQPEKCYLGYVKPCIYCDGYVYPCSSVVLNPDSNKVFGEKYRICKIEDIDKMYSKPMTSFMNMGQCTGCVFTSQNDILTAVLDKVEQQEFV